jgi:hypothetical protein
MTAIGTANAAKRTTEKINIFFMPTSSWQWLPEPTKAIRDRHHVLKLSQHQKAAQQANRLCCDVCHSCHL